MRNSLKTRIKIKIWRVDFLLFSRGGVLLTLVCWVGFAFYSWLEEWDTSKGEDLLYLYASLLFLMLLGMYIAFLNDRSFYMSIAGIKKENRAHKIFANIGFMLFTYKVMLADNAIYRLSSSWVQPSYTMSEEEFAEYKKYWKFLELTYDAIRDAEFFLDQVGSVILTIAIIFFSIVIFFLRKKHKINYYNVFVFFTSLAFQFVFVVIAHGILCCIWWFFILNENVICCGLFLFLLIIAHIWYQM